MIGRNHILLSAVASALFATVCIFPHTTVTSNRLSSKYFYKHPKLGFSLEYSALLTAQEFPNGVVLENNAMQIYDRINIYVTNCALQLGCSNGSVETFKSFSSAKAGEIVKGSESGTYTKIANLKVNGYPAVRVVYEVSHEYAVERNTKSSDLPPFVPVYSVSVYIKKGTDIWEVMSHGIDKETQEKSAKPFEEILRTLKFA